MLFNSIEFLIFFPIVVMLYFIISPKYRWILLLGASYYFYMSWKAEYLILIFTSTLITYLSGILISGTNNQKKKKQYLKMSLLINLLILFVFKYYNFATDSINSVMANFNSNIGIPNLKLLLPVGISFYTFQALSYSMDVYRGKIKAEKHFGIYALYVSFFPQLVAGPIERSDKLLPQFKKKFEFDYDRVTDGLKRMLWGYFKKVVVADRVAIVVNNVYNYVGEFSGPQFVIATIFFGVQIYCDFSAYSDIAIGSAQIMGYDLMDNFKRPYYSKSIAEFWRRWHISLSTWFRDYLYIPLGGNRVSKPRYYFNLFITFLISGLWHGASWNFVIWGGLHGFYLVFADMTKEFRDKTRDKIGFTSKSVLKYYRVFIVFVLVNFAWIFFRANTFSDAVYVIQNLFSGYRKLLSFDGIYEIVESLGLSKIKLIITVFSIAILEIFHLMQRHGSIRHMLRQKPIWLRWGIYYILIFWILLFGEYGQPEFIYFQF